MSKRADQLAKIVKSIHDEGNPFVAAGVIDGDCMGILMSGKPHQIVNIITLVLAQIEDQYGVPYKDMVKTIKKRQKDIPNAFKKEMEEKNNGKNR